MDWAQADRMLKEMQKITTELRRVADALSGIVRDGSPFVDPYGNEVRDSANPEDGQKPA